MTFAGETAVFDLGDGRQLVVKNWPAASLEPEARWEASIRTTLGGYSLPLPVIRIEQGT